MENNQQIDIPKFIQDGALKTNTVIYNFEKYKEEKDLMIESEKKYKRAKKNSCGKKRKKAIKKRKKVNNNSLKKWIIGITVTGMVVATVGTVIYNKYQSDSPQDKISITVESISESIDELTAQIYLNIQAEANNEVFTNSVKGQSNGTFYYDFSDASNKFRLGAINAILKYAGTDAIKIWDEVLAEEERSAIAVSSLVGRVTNFDGGVDNKRNVVFNIVGGAAADEYVKNSDEYIAKQTEIAKAAVEKIAQLILSEELNLENTTGRKIN